jgi:hypothetical protein
MTDKKKKPKLISPNALTPVAAIAELNKKYAVVLEGGKVRVLTFSAHGGRETVDYLSFADFKNLHMHRSVIVGNGITVPLGHFWLKHSERKQYAGVTFEPLKARIVDGKLNLWRGWGVEPKEGDWPLMQRHITEVLAACNTKHEQYILNYAAWCVQHPAEPAETALVFRGPQGTGRGIFGRGMCRIFGQHAHQISSIKHLTGEFNKHLRDCCLLFADEAYWPGHRSMEGTLNRLVTEPTLFIEPKGLDAFEVRNMLHIIMASNNRWVVPAAWDARRWVVMDVAEDKKQDPDWFVPLYQEKNGDGLAAMLHDLLARDLGDWHPRQIIRTAALRDQQLLSLDSLDPVDAWWFTLISDGMLPRCSYMGPNEPSVSDKPRRALSSDLFKHARESVPRLKYESEHMLGRALRERGCRAFNYPARGWEFPPLEEARAKWNGKMPDHDWDDQRTDWQLRGSKEPKDETKTKSPSGKTGVRF